MNPKSPDFSIAPQQRRKRTRFLLAPLLFCGATGGLSISAAQAQDAAAVLDMVRQSETKIQLQATQVVQRGGAREVATLYRSGLKRRLEWSAPGVKAGDVLVDDGETVTLFHRAEKTAFQTKSLRRAGTGLGGEWKVGAPVQQEGRAVRVLSRGNGRELTVDAKTGAILRIKNPSSVTSLQNVRFGAIAASKFQFSAPAGARVVRTDGRYVATLDAATRLASWLQTPAQLPAGYAFESAVAGKTEVWLRYSNGKKRFSIFQQKTGDGDLAPQKVDGGYFWRKNGLRFVATGAPTEAFPGLSQ